MSVGGGATEQVIAEDLETNLSMVKFDIPTTPENIANARLWKVKRGTNVVTLAGETSDGDTFTRTFQRAILTQNYEVGIGTEANIPIEFQSNAAV